MDIFPLRQEANPEARVRMTPIKEKAMAKIMERARASSRARAEAGAEAGAESLKKSVSLNRIMSLRQTEHD